MTVKRTYQSIFGIVLVLALALAACSGSGQDDDDSATTTTAGDEAATGDDGETAPDDDSTIEPDAGEGDFAPVTIEHRYGSTEIAERPETIVSLDTQWTDVLTALDAPPAGHLRDLTLQEQLPWQDGLGESDPLVIGSAAEIGNLLEEVIALDPDLIVVTYLAEDEDDYRQLADIAPTIATLSDSQVDTWQDIAGAAGQVLGDTEAADALVADVEGQVEAIATDLPELEGKDFTFANYVPGDAMYVLSDPDDGANALFTKLGLVIAPAILDAEDDSPGRVKLSLELVDLLDADLVVILTNDADPAEVPGFSDLPAVEAGASLEMDYAMAVALNTPTPLSIPYALDELRPALEAAAQA